MPWWLGAVAFATSDTGGGADPGSRWRSDRHAVSGDTGKRFSPNMEAEVR